MRPGSAEFKELSNYLESEGIMQMSDSNKPAYFRAKGRSTIDYVFGSSDMKMKTFTINTAASGHAVLGVNCRISQNDRIKTSISYQTV